MAEPSNEGGWIVAPFLGCFIRVPELIRQERIAIWQQYRMAMIGQIVFYLIVFVASPGYVLPFVNYVLHTNAYLWVVAILCVEVLLIWAHWKLAPITNWNRIACYLYAVVFGVGPGYLIPFAGPAIVTITNSCGPCRL